MDLIIQDLKEIKEKYNIEEDLIIKILEKLLKKKFNFGEIRIKNNRIYELVLKSKTLKERKIRLTKKNINLILSELRKKLLLLSKLNKKKKILNSYFLNVIKGRVIGKDKFSYHIKFDNYIGILYFNKAKKKYSLNDVDFFHINKIKFNDREEVIYLDDYSVNITKYKIFNLLDGLYVKNIIINKDKVIIKTNAKIPKNLLKEIENLTKLKVYIKLLKDMK